MKRNMFSHKRRITPKEINMHNSSEQRLTAMYEMIGSDTLKSEDLYRYREGNRRFIDFMKDAESLILKGLDSSDDKQRIEALSQISILPQEDRLSIIQSALNDANNLFRMTAVGQVGTLLIEDRFDIIHKAQLDDDEYVRSRAIGRVNCLPEEERLSIVKRALEDPDEYTRKGAIRKVGMLPEGERLNIVERALSDSSVLVRCKALEYIADLPEKERMNIVSNALRDPEKVVRITALKHIEYLSDEERERTLKHFKKDNDIDVQNILMRWVKLDSEDKEEKEYLESLKEFASSSSLYLKTPDTFVRHDFEKTGSSTLLVDQVPFFNKDTSWKERVAIRTLSVVAVQAWKTAYECMSEWKEQGFDYVPVEPIVKISPPTQPDIHVDVYTRVIPGPSIEAWKQKTVLYKKEIEKQRDRIIATLETLKIDHGHPHDGNFVLHFYKTEDGEVDLSRVPRVYIIDFDMALINN